MRDFKMKPEWNGWRRLPPPSAPRTGSFPGRASPCCAAGRPGRVGSSALLATDRLVEGLGGERGGRGERGGVNGMCAVHWYANELPRGPLCSNFSSRRR